MILMCVFMKCVVVLCGVRLVDYMVVCCVACMSSWVLVICVVVGVMVCC